MFDEAVLTEAVEIHQRCYRLLLWVGDAIQREFIPITRARISTRANAKPPKSGFPSLSRTCQLSRVVALAAYGRELLYRCQGQGKSGPAVLALWREFAEE